MSRGCSRPVAKEKLMFQKEIVTVEFGIMRKGHPQSLHVIPSALSKVGGENE